MVVARILLSAAAVIWGWTFVASKVALAQLAPHELLALRFGMALPLLAVIAFARRRAGTGTGTGASAGATNRRALAAAGVLFAVHFAVQTEGLVYTTATNTSWIIALVPLVLAACAALLAGERLGRRTLVGMAVASTGILLLVSRGRWGELGWLRSIGDWLVLASTVTWSLYTVATRAAARQRDSAAVTFWVMLPSTVLFVSLAVIQRSWHQLVRLDAASWLAILFLGLVGTALPQWFWQVGVGRLGSARAGVYLYLEPLATTALAVPYLGEPLTLPTLAGGALVVGGVAWARDRGYEAREGAAPRAVP